jgi:hypothetical protein
MLITLVIGLARSWPQREGDAFRGTDVWAHIAYWGATLFAVSGAFLFSGFGQDSTSIRYLTSLVIAVGALLPIAVVAGSRLRLAAVAVTAVYALASILGLALRPGDQFASRPQSLRDLSSFLQAHDLHKGYASYWDATPVTYLTGSQVEVWPVLEGAGCAGNESNNLCRYPALSAQAWYQDSGATTFLVLRPGAVCLTGPPGPGYGPPIATYNVDNYYTVLVYPYDLASRMTQSRFSLCPPE